jgi:hypothetical protein
MTTVQPVREQSRQPERRPAEALRCFFRCALRRPTVMRALGVAAIITPILMLVNHWAELAAGRLDARLALQTLLTFCVPYAVATYSSARADMARCGTEFGRTGAAQS